LVGFIENTATEIEDSEYSFTDWSLVCRDEHDNRKHCFIDDSLLLKSRSPMKVEGLRSPYQKVGNLYHAAKFLARVKAEEGLEHRTDVVTAFDLIDLREGRGERSEGASKSPESPPPLR
jgi:hypothetical protein